MDLPILCTLTQAELQERRRELLDRVKTSATKATELHDGFAYEFPSDPELLAMLGRLIALEHECCRFLTFKISLKAGEDSVILEVTSPPEAKPIIADFLGAAHPTNG
jgi:hypothetical protein